MAPPYAGRYDLGVTLPDLGSEGLTHASETRKLAARVRTQPGGHVSGRAFWTAFAVIAIAIGLFALILLRG
jgi:hypothetical protein